MTASAFRGFWATVTLILVAGIFYESSRPLGSPALPDLTTLESTFGHFAASAGLAYCATTALLSRRLGAIVAVIAACCAYGVFNELYQTGVPGRDASVADALTNLGGATLGALAAWAMVRRWRRLIGP